MSLSSQSLDKRAFLLIEKNIEKLELDLTDKVILTEVGSSNYGYSPLIPLMAGAKKV